MASVDNGVSITLGTVDPSVVGTQLTTLLTADDIQPGTSPSYELCKVIYLYHPLGQKIAEGPIRKAMSQDRQITIADEPDEVAEEFRNVWRDMLIDRVILSGCTQSRVYAQASIAILIEGDDQTSPLDYESLWKKVVAFNVWDPLNTSGSVIGNQVPTAMDFQKHGDIAVQGQKWHRSRTITIVNEQPIYIAWTTSAYGYSGRSVYQRALYPLKTFVQTMITDDLVTIKAGVLVAKLKIVSSIVDQLQKWTTGIKRALIKIARVGGVLSINPEEEIASLNLQNLHEPMKMARDNSLKNTAMAVDMPAVMLEDETMTEGFGEGTEDAKVIARYIERIRKDYDQLYAWFTQIVQYRAWTPEFYERMKRKYPEAIKDDYTTTFYRWKNKFSAVWPNLLVEPDSEKAKNEKVKHEAMVDTLTTLLPILDPVNKAATVQWFADTISQNKLLFPIPLVIDADALAAYVPPTPQGDGIEGVDKEPDPPKPKHDDAGDELPRLPLRGGARGINGAEIARAVDAMTMNGTVRQ